MPPFESLVPLGLRTRPGLVYCSGPKAFSGERHLYLLGLNPGGESGEEETDSIAGHLSYVAGLSDRWSAYVDQEWGGRPAGTHPFQRSVRHLFEQVGLDPTGVPSSNLVFVRSRIEAAIAADEMERLIEVCWPFHEAVIRELGVRVVLCLGGTVGRAVRARLGAHSEIAHFRETNARGWVSRVHEAPDGVRVATLTHPSRAAWSNPDADVSALVAAAMEGGRTEGAVSTRRTPLTRAGLLRFNSAWLDSDRALIEEHLAGVDATFTEVDPPGYRHFVEVRDRQGGVVMHVSKGSIYRDGRVHRLSTTRGGGARRSAPAEPILPPLCSACFVHHRAGHCDHQ